MRILVEAYGCTLNRGEADEFIDGLVEAGHEPVVSQEDAEAFVIFTCGVIDTTERRMLRKIGEFSKEPEKPLLVCGCLSNICPDKIRKIAPHAMLFGPSEQINALKSLGAEWRPNKTARNGAVGILPIATGCKGSCTYCVTRNARGALKSRTPKDLRQRLGALVNSGAAEIQLCAQDSAVYGADLGIGLGELIGTLESVNGDFMMRIGMMNPSGVKTNSDNILAAYGSHKVFKFLHLPVQSGSDSVLERMGRRYTVEDFSNIVREFRSRFPGLTLSTDIIVGFPGETDDEFLESMKLMRAAKPDIINITRFSSRPGTGAHTMKPKIISRKIKDRSKIMTDLRFELTGENYRDMAGMAVRALATERKVPGTTLLRTPEYKPVVVDGEAELGKWHSVEITGNARAYLSGILNDTSD
ncbi:MAG: tRNA (N(6)-L-threonylcarbamoyladenosine(37)-C(2))-methylthiotransferase [Candidatus Thermoplasmatota archaeon]|nr:tRNA (N(6)-L-threonylcarbamoyladenosine(37)-C(2))-methylthiotransferase [Candidatus Thermoplasmatota archaeon]MBU4143806.1 tRNA (N(6)-L-threonylcarbamoyladenosine(37)-C(2))-methylthiotransferase [Candidatus Thermoplasmatota archaeon]MBU4592464.1 tRNA (N(6)-L-threonylcarbamoyladenosine(37)-C(2))-methylthiotransferase [Candidatus Thermoplasmatota archaeon]